MQSYFVDIQRKMAIQTLISCSQPTKEKRNSLFTSYLAIDYSVLLPLNSFCEAVSNWWDCATVLIRSWITTLSYIPASLQNNKLQYTVQNSMYEVLY